jgi:hypothetical protein
MVLCEFYGKIGTTIMNPDPEKARTSTYLGTEGCHEAGCYQVSMLKSSSI